MSPFLIRPLRGHLPPGGRHWYTKGQFTTFLSSPSRGAQRMYDDHPASVTYCPRPLAAGRGAQRMYDNYPVFVTHWQAALRPALSAATRRQITISRTAEVSRSTFCLILESVIMQNDESHCLSRNFRKGSLHFGKNRL